MKDKEKFVPHGVTGIGTDNDLFYKEYLSSANGMDFELFKDSHNTEEDVRRAKIWLKNNHDVLYIKVISFITHAIYSR